MPNKEQCCRCGSRDVEGERPNHRRRFNKMDANIGVATDKLLSV
jgi:hypothetical protein